MKNKTVLGVVKNVIRQNRVRAAFLVFVALASVLLALAPPQIMRVIIDRYLTPGITAGLMETPHCCMSLSSSSARRTFSAGGS